MGGVMKAAPIDLAPLRALAQRALGDQALANSPVDIAELPGGASTRRFFRVRSATGTAVGMFTPDAHRSEEASHDSTAPVQRWPFLEVRDLLAQRGVHVPALLGQDEAAGWLLLEDCGDVTLAEALRLRPELKTELYRIAVRDLARAHTVLEALPPASIVSTRRFDKDLLLWELEHFYEFGVLARDIRPSDAQRARFTQLAADLAELVANLPQGFVHRDYQSRNLMWVPSDLSVFSGQTPSLGSEAVELDGKLVWIDFQDALIGPRVYDLVALLNDSYQSFSRTFTEQRLNEYVHARGLPASELAAIVREFDIVTVQRKLKDAGRFVYFDVHKGDASYVGFVAPTLAKVRASLERLQDEPLFRDWQALLGEMLA